MIIFSCQLSVHTSSKQNTWALAHSCSANCTHHNNDANDDHLSCQLSVTQVQNRVHGLWPISVWRTAPMIVNTITMITHPVSPLYTKTPNCVQEPWSVSETCSSMQTVAPNSKLPTRRPQNLHSLATELWNLRQTSSDDTVAPKCELGNGALDPKTQNMRESVTKQRTRENRDNRDSWQHEDVLDSSIYNTAPVPGGVTSGQTRQNAHNLVPLLPSSIRKF